jgi:hypothetical protein
MASNALAAQRPDGEPTSVDLVFAAGALAYALDAFNPAFAAHPAHVPPWLYTCKEPEPARKYVKAELRTAMRRRAQCHG